MPHKIFLYAHPLTYFQFVKGGKCLSIIGEYVKLAEEERVVKDYYALRKPRGAKEGHMCITNKRVIMYSFGGLLKGKEVKTICELQINSVRGVDVSSKGFSIAKIVIGLVWLLIGGWIFLMYKGALPPTDTTGLIWFAIAVGMIALGLYLIYSGIFAKGFFMMVDVDAVTPAMWMVAGSGWMRFRGQFMVQAPFILEGKKPGPDAEALKQEFGAIILDTQIGRESLLAQSSSEKQRGKA